MIVRDAAAAWNKTLKQGHGTLRFGKAEMPYSFASRFEQAEGTNPEELMGAAHAGCFSMALALMLGKAGYEPEFIQTTARVHLDPEQLTISRIELRTKADVPRIKEDEFGRIAEDAKVHCPVSKALAGTEIILEEAELTSAQIATERG